MGNDPERARCNGCDRHCRFKHFRSGDVDDGWSETAPVGALDRCRGPAPVYDLIGNVAEWCHNPGKSPEFSVRGGSWGQIDAFL